jgi:hypothetical protein
MSVGSTVSENSSVSERDENSNHPVLLQDMSEVTINRSKKLNSLMSLGDETYVRERRSSITIPVDSSTSYVEAEESFI